MKHSFPLLLAALSVFVTLPSACDERSYPAELVTADSLADHAPDSALRLLKLKATELVRGSDDHHLACLIHAQTGTLLLYQDVCEKALPHFRERPTSLYPAITNVEYRISLLLRMGMQPGQIAIVTARSKQAISSMRSRLYRKVFGKKGAAEEWDQFVRDGI